LGSPEGGVVTDSLADLMRDVMAEVMAAPLEERCRQCGCPTMRDSTCADCEARTAAMAARVAWAPRRYQWAVDLDAADLPARVTDARAVDAMRSATDARAPSIVLLGVAGSGKTSLAVAGANARYTSTSWRRIAFVDALDLSTARARAPLGDEAPLVASAISAHLVVLDELGRGRGGHFDATGDVIMARHNADKSTIYTSPCPTLPDLVARLNDDGLARRVLAQATVIQLRVTR
jgi:DNA replication protein DnaC